MNCYFEYSGSSQPADHSSTGPCSTSANGETVACCDVGDFCLSNGLCQIGAPDSGETGGSGYYMGGCTDHTFTSDLCPRNCTAYANSAVVYDYGLDVWQCCGLDSNKQLNCSIPEGPTMTAPSPAELRTIATVYGTATFSAMATAAAILPLSASGSSQAASSPVASSSTGSGGLSAGAAAGIGVAGVLGLLVVLAGVGFLVWRAKGRPAFGRTPYHQYNYPDQDGHQAMQHQQGEGFYAKEPAIPAARQELKSTPSFRRHELPPDEAYAPDPRELGTRS